MEKKIPGRGGLNSDDDLRAIPDGDLPIGQLNAQGAINCRIGLTDQGSSFAVENTKGNTLVSYALPAGTNKTIGAREFENPGVVVYFNYNSLNNHQILQYSYSTNKISLVAQGIALNFNINFKVTGINLIQNSDLTWGLYWTDNYNEPRKINLTQAINGWLGVPTTEDAYKLYSTGNLGGIDNANTFTPGQLNLKEYIYAIKTPPLYPPIPYYLTDLTRNSNYLNSFLWQFQYRFIYDDKENSAPSPISIVPLPDLDSSTLTDSYANNYIQIQVNTGSSIVSKIEVWGRLGNTGPMQSLITLTKSDPYNPINDNTTYNYNFYNDGVYSNVNIPDAINLFDSVPQLASAQALIEPTRIAYGNAVDGFNQVPVVAELELTLPPTTSQFFTIVCNDVTIISPFNTNTFTQTGGFAGVGYRPYQNGIDLQCSPIWRTVDPNNTYPGSDTGPVFGGLSGVVIDGGGFNYSADTVQNNYNQSLPLGGFCFYLAGTNNYAISRQVIHPNNRFSQDASTGCIVFNLDDTNAGQQQDLNAYLVTNNVYSTFTLGNVAPGEYILRVADHNTQASELLDTTLAYQTRSTYTCMVGGVQSHEVVIKIIPVGSGFQVYVNGVLNSYNTTTNTITIGSCVIADMTSLLDQSIPNPGQGNKSNVVSGYLIDHDTTLPASPTDEEYLGETRIDLAGVTFSPPPGRGPVSTFNNNPILNTWNSGYTYTDHNGFFFFGASYLNQSISSSFIQLSGAFTGPTNIGPSIYSQSGSNYSGGTNNSRLFLRSPTDGLTENNRTKIFVNIYENIYGTNIPTNGISAVVGRGGFCISGSAGNAVGVATIIAYNDSRGGGLTRSDHVYYKSSDDAFFDSYLPADDFFNINFGAVGSPTTTSPYTGVYNYSSTASPVSTILILQNVIATLSGKNPARSNLKRAGTYQYGICYYDHANRSGTTNTNDYTSLTTISSASGTKGNTYGLKLYVPFYTELNPTTGVIWGGQAPSVQWSIYNEPPTWATHYQWVRTKDTAVSSFIQFVANNPTYLDSNGNATVYGASDAVKISFDLSSITNYDTDNPTSTLVYDWTLQPDDHVRLIRDNNGNFYTSYIDSLVIGFNGQTATSTTKTGSNTLVIENNSSINFDISQQPGLLLEIYNPKLQLQTGESIFWEIGECYQIGTDGNGIPYHIGPSGTQTTDYAINPSTGLTIPVSSVPAMGTFIGGDMYYRTRNMPFNTLTNSPSFKIYVIEDPSVSDFYQSNISDIGRPNKYDPTATQVRRISTIWYSQLFIPETNINGLNTFYSTNFNTYEQKYGPIMKLYNENHRLIVYQYLKVGQVPINQAMVYDQAQNQQLVYTEQVLNDIIYYEGEYGMTNPESFAVFGTDKYHIDYNRLVPLRLANDGLKPISENDSKQIRMHNYWTNRLNAYKGVSNVFIYGVFDKKFKNYVVAMEPILGPAGIVIGSAQTQAPILTPSDTIVWDEQANRWRSRFSFTPDFMVQSQDNIISFHNGQLYIHNSNPAYNNFYGVQYGMEIDLSAVGGPVQGESTPTAPDPSKVKVLHSLSLEATDTFQADIYTPEGQWATVYTGDYQNIENIFYAPVLQDQLTPNVANPGIEGDSMRSTNFLVRLTNTNTGFVKIFSTNLNYANSERSNR